MIRPHLYSICSVHSGLIIEFNDESEIHIVKSLMIYFSVAERKYFSIRTYLCKALREVADGSCSRSCSHLILGTCLPCQW